MPRPRHSNSRRVVLPAAATAATMMGLLQLVALLLASFYSFQEAAAFVLPALPAVRQHQHQALRRHLWQPVRMSEVLEQEAPGGCLFCVHASVCLLAA